jgi:hypothetical protein
MIYDLFAIDTDCSGRLFTRRYSCFTYQHFPIERDL